MSMDGVLQGRSRLTLVVAASLLVLAALVFYAPYAVRVAPSVSLSYVVGYSNKAALVLFLCGALGFAHGFRRLVPVVDLRDSALAVRELLFGELAVLALCVASALWMPLGGEAQYILHRQNLLAMGPQLYTGFDFLYGPALVMPGYWLMRVGSVSPAAGYLLSWGLQWVAGVGMLWFSVRSLPMKVPYRRTLFAVLLTLELPEILGQGTNYTPFRRYAAAALACLVYRVWLQRRSPWGTAWAGVAAVVLGLCVSPEQAFGLAFGLLAWFVLLAVQAKTFPLAGVAVFVAASASCFALAAGTGMFREFLAAASGGFSMPLLATVENCVVLGIYLFAVIELYSLVAKNQAESGAVLLVLCGLPMLPSAMGRCDSGHIFSAMPALLIGAASMLAMTRARRWFLPLAFLFWLNIVGVYPVLRYVMHAVRHQPAPLGQAELTADQLPCDRRYYVPTLLLNPTVAYSSLCLDLGYKRGLSDIYTSGQIQDEITELKARPRMPLLLEDQPFAQTFAPHESNLAVLRGMEGQLRLSLPRARNAAIPFQPIGDYIDSHYTRGISVLGGRLYVWEPR